MSEKEVIEGVVEVYPYEYNEVNDGADSLQRILGKRVNKKVRVTVETI